MSTRVLVLSHMGESHPQFHVEARAFRGTVHLASSSGSCSFFHQMTPAQARVLADALHAFAAVAEQQEATA